jgi:hypothetical protein
MPPLDRSSGRAPSRSSALGFGRVSADTLDVPLHEPREVQLEGRIRGSFPGGPRKKIPAAERRSAPRLERIEQIEERAVGRSLGRVRRRRRKSLALALFAAVVTSAGAGVYLGLGSNQTVEEVRAAQEAEASPVRGFGDMDEMSAEVNRALLELWKMEDVEFARNSAR